MGWISDRHMKSGGSINGRPSNNGSKNGPLCKVEQILRRGTSIFDRNRVIFECGHEGSATIGARRGRCRHCRRGEENALVPK